MEKKEYEKTVQRVGIITIIWNFILSLSKLIGGILAKSTSLISDGIHSASDVMSTIVVIIGAKMSQKEADSEHPFGHERMESVASFILAALLMATALSLGYSGVVSIIEYAKGQRVETNGVMLWIALGFAIASIIIKAWMYFYTMYYAKKINSTGLKADAFHHLTDSLSSIASVLGIVGLLLGGDFSIADPIATIIIAIFIVKVSIDIAIEAINQVVDKAAPIEFQQDIFSIASKTKGVMSINSLKTRMFGNMYYVELEIAVLDNLTVKEGHAIAEEIHDALENKYLNIKHCMIHVDPYSIVTKD